MTGRLHRTAWAAFALAFALVVSVAVQAQSLIQTETLKGKLLVAAPSMPSGYFARSVIYMLQHDETGAMGVVVNIPMGILPFASIFKGLGLEPEIDGDLADIPIRVYSGGPVDTGRGFILHADDSLSGAGEFELSRSIELMRAIAAGEGPRRSLLLFGYAGWAPGQLEHELKRDDWIAVKADEDLVFDSDDGTKWRRSLELLEINL
ncbi:MAG: YqgE/AlgH family protein [Alphaproteobacteria bacterium]